MLDNNSVDKLNRLYDDFRVFDTFESSWYYMYNNSKVGFVLSLIDIEEEDIFNKLDYEVHPELLENNNKHDLLYEFVSSIKKSFIVIDRDIANVVCKLNRNGYITEFSCQGHYEEPKIVTDPYICFNTNKLDPILEAIKLGNTDICIHITCANIYHKIYNVSLYPASHIFTDFLDDNDDKYNEKILLVFKRWIENSLVPFVYFICEKE